LALVERIAAELGIDAEVRPTRISDQTTAGGRDLWARPRSASTAAMSTPKASWPPSTAWSVACTGMSIALPATTRNARSARLAQAPELLAQPPVIEPVDVLAAMLHR
jgi:hypothetical protein